MGIGRFGLACVSDEALEAWLRAFARAPLYLRYMLAPLARRVRVEQQRRDQAALYELHRADFDQDDGLPRVNCEVRSPCN